MTSSDEMDLKDPKNWSVEDEVYLLYSTIDNKPVGLDKHFQMSVIWNKFTSNSNKLVSSDVLWTKLSSWYNLKKLDEFEAIPIDQQEEDFLLPAEVVPEYVLKNLTDEDRKYIDFSGTHKKFISAIETSDDDVDRSQFKWKGSDKMKWFESPQTYKLNERLSKKSYDSKSKSDFTDSASDALEVKKVIRQYGKAGEVSSGSYLTLNITPSLFDESDENMMEVDQPTDETGDLKRNASSIDAINDSDKASKAKKKRSTKSDTSAVQETDMSENYSPVKNASRSAKATEPITRGRKASSASQDVSSGTESEKNVSMNDENSKNSKRRFSQRVSTLETPVKSNEMSSKTDAKRKPTPRR